MSLSRALIEHDAAAIINRNLVGFLWSFGKQYMCGKSFWDSDKVIPNFLDKCFSWSFIILSTGLLSLEYVELPF